jgi:AraC-like DNA-binding protein
MNLYIKYMVSLRCKMLVTAELEALAIPYIFVDLGMVKLADAVPDYKYQQLKKRLLRSGLELIDDEKSVLTEKIKNVIIGMIQHSDDLPEVSYSHFISKELDMDYTYLSNIFSQQNGITIQHFIILHKIERAKELIMYDELNLTEISFKLHYSSVAHLSNQFKKVTGISPSYYKHSQLG